MRRPIGVVAQSSGVDREATGRENLTLQGQPLRAARQRARRAASTSCSSSFGLADAADRVAPRLLRRHAAPARHRDGARPRPATCCSWTSRPPASTRRCAPRCGARSPACTEERGPDHPADHALPRGGRPAGRRSWRSSTAAGSSPRARRRSSRASCAATPCTSSWRRAATSALRSRRSGVSGRARGHASTGAALRARADDGARAVPGVLAALEAAGMRRRLGDGRPAVAGRRLPAARRPRVLGRRRPEGDAMTALARAPAT